MLEKTKVLNEIKNFDELSDFVEHQSYEKLQEAVLLYWGDNSPLYDFITQWDMVVPKNTNFSADEMLESIKNFKDYFQEYKKTYLLLTDIDSKALLLKIYIYKLCGNRDLLFNDKIVNPYFYNKPIHISPGEVLVDCGSYDGVNIAEFMILNPSFKCIYSYEPSPCSYRTITEKYKYFINEGLLVPRNAAVSDTNGTSKFFYDEKLPTAAKIDNEGNTVVTTVSIDEDIQEPVTFIKMDIEGSEIEAIIGAKRHIAEDSPVLAICVYHLIDDLWRIPALINSINPHYKYYLGYHSTLYFCNLVLYCYPPPPPRAIKSDAIRSNIFYQELLKVVSSYLHSGTFDTSDDKLAYNLSLLFNGAMHLSSELKRTIIENKQDYENSTSWRITKPLRTFKNLLKK